MNKENTDEIYRLEPVAELLPMEEPQRQRAYMELLKAHFSRIAGRLGRPLTMCTVTFGCPMVIVTQKCGNPLFI